MDTFAHTAERVQRLLETGQIEEAERLIDHLAAQGARALDQVWDLGEVGVRHYLSIFYNNIGMNYQSVGIEAHRRNDWQGGMEAARAQERCHHKAFDLYDISAESVLYFPRRSPFDKNLIFTFWGLGTAKYVLNKEAESRKYLLLCLRIHAEDEQAAAWQSDASNYLRLLDRKPVQLVLRARSVLPQLTDQQRLQVEGELLEWGAYAKPRQTEFAVSVTDEMIDRLNAQGLRTPASLEGHILVLASDPSGDFRRPFRIVQVI